MDLLHRFGLYRGLSGGFVARNEDDLWRLGAVAFVSSGPRYAAVQKAPRPTYAFSDLWALPGGMIRATPGVPVAYEDVVASLSDRVRNESGLRIVSSELVSLGPIVTAYTARGYPRLTLVAAFGARCLEHADLRTGDPSIQASTWLDEDAGLLRFAPANQLVLSHLLWDRATEARRVLWRRQLEPALTACAEAARRAEIAAPEPPWAETEALQFWRNAWPSI